MTQSNEPNDSQREINRRFRDLSWRVERLETSQMPARSLSESFVDPWSAFGNRVYDEIDALEDIVNQRFDRLESEVSEMRSELRAIGNKFDIVMTYITGQGNS